MRGNELGNKPLHLFGYIYIYIYIFVIGIQKKKKESRLAQSSTLSIRIPSLPHIARTTTTRTWKISLSRHLASSDDYLQGRLSPVPAHTQPPGEMEQSLGEAGALATGCNITLPQRALFEAFPRQSLEAAAHGTD